ncbi:putative aminopeptidase W07G4.4 isoform X1 [Plutella xylostella]|uniref:putative aminopeptidase W07G4.4 isoform X1 n=2 Tax=Plutella xylostella TaxID=51655 RepID=UPI002032CD08|nr:putative aminopeptidase W07G4.4 isoform X1 [Plutella xylostella]
MKSYKGYLLLTVTEYLSLIFTCVMVDDSMGVEVNGVSVEIVKELNDNSYDAVILVTSPKVAPVQALEDFVVAAVQIDKGLEKVPAVLSCPRVSGGRLVVSPTGPITPYDDVRSISEAAKRGLERAMQAGARRPVLVLQPHPQFKQAELVVLLAALEALYVPIQIRELCPDKRVKLRGLGIYGEGVKGLEVTLKNAVALEAGRAVARDIGGGDPERMTPIAVAEYVTALFKDTSVSVRVVSDRTVFEKEYPLYAAVDRAASGVARHKGRIIFLEYTPSQYEETVMLVGKGVTYDTGGCDIKAGGVMAGMSRDKCGAAAVAGFVKACQLLQPRLKVVAALSMARNSVGADAYVADELITSRSGRTVRVGNTDAEGRMIMADLLFEMKERAVNEKNPHIYTVATLTGHAIRAVGLGYTIVMDNHAARYKDHARQFQLAGEAVGDMVEVSTIRREDLKVHRGQAEFEDVHQALNQPSSAVPRGHQGPAGFLLLTSDLDVADIPYSHLDVAGSGGCLPDPPTGSPVLALANKYGLLHA